MNGLDNMLLLVTDGDDEMYSRLSGEGPAAIAEAGCDRIAELEAEVEYHKHLALEALERLEELEEVAGDGDGDWYWRATGDYVGGTADKGE